MFGVEGLVKSWSYVESLRFKVQKQHCQKTMAEPRTQCTGARTTHLDFLNNQVMRNASQRGAKARVLEKNVRTFVTSPTVQGVCP